MKKFKILLPYLIVVFISAIPLFAHLDALPIRLWDESRLATNTYEMYQSDRLLVTTFQGKPDHWNTKPPLLIWMQYGSMHIFGVTELAVRLPSVLAGLAVFLCLVYFFRKTGFHWAGALAAILLLLISPGYNGEHGLRFGEYDALLSLFILIQSMSFYLYVSASQPAERKKFLFVFLAAIVLGIWTKGVAGLILSPVFLIGWFAWRMWEKDRLLRVVLYALGALLISLSYYFIREAYDPGYIRVTISEEITNRYISEPDKTTQPWDYYLKLFPFQTAKWIYVVLPVILLGLVIARRDKRKPVIYFMACALFYYLVIQTSDGKNFWYSLPIYPLLYLSFGLALDIIVRRASNLFRRPVFAPFFITLVVLIFAWPYYNLLMDTLGTRQKPQRDYGFYNTTLYLRNQLDAEEKINLKFIDTDYSAHNWWYITLLNEKGHDISSYHHLDSIQPGDLVLTRQGNIADSLHSRFIVEEQPLNLYRCHLIRVYDKRN